MLQSIELTMNMSELTPLMQAARIGNVQDMKELMDKGVSGVKYIWIRIEFIQCCAADCYTRQS